MQYAIAVLIARAADLDPDRISFTGALRIVRGTATGTADIPPHDRTDALPKIHLNYVALGE